jgi:hypothetical protein
MRPSRELVPTSQRDLHRYHTLRLVIECRLTGAQAATALGLTERPVWWLLARLRQDGRRALVHGNWGRPSGRRLPWATRQQETAGRVRLAAPTPQRALRWSRSGPPGEDPVRETRSPRVRRHRGAGRDPSWHRTTAACPNTRRESTALFHDRPAIRERVSWSHECLCD